MTQKKNKVTLCIPVRGPEPMLVRTIESARRLAGMPIDVCIVRDGPGPITAEIDCDDWLASSRIMGSSFSRHQGMIRAQTEIVVCADGHMAFQEHWAVHVADFFSVKKNRDKVACAMMGECDHNNTAMVTKPLTGARIAYKTIEVGPPDVNFTEMRAMHGKWTEQQPGPISCVMGAFYAMRKETYIRKFGSPWQVGTGYGSDEELISIAAHFLGDGVELLDLVAYHHFRARNLWLDNFTVDDTHKIWHNRFRLLAILPMGQEERDDLYAWQFQNRDFIVNGAMYRDFIERDWNRPEVRALARRIAEKSDLTWDAFKAAQVKVYENPDVSKEGLEKRKATMRRFDQPALMTTTTDPHKLPDDWKPKPRRCLNTVPQQIFRHAEVCVSCDARNPFKVIKTIPATEHTPKRQYLKCSRCGRGAIRLSDGPINQDRAVEMSRFE